MSRRCLSIGYWELLQDLAGLEVLEAHVHPLDRMHESHEARVTTRIGRVTTHISYIYNLSSELLRVVAPAMPALQTVQPEGQVPTLLHAVVAQNVAHLVLQFRRNLLCTLLVLLVYHGDECFVLLVDALAAYLEWVIMGSYWTVGVALTVLQILIQTLDVHHMETLGQLGSRLAGVKQVLQTEETVVVGGVRETLVVLLESLAVVYPALVTVEELVLPAHPAYPALVAVIHGPFGVIGEQHTHTAEVGRHLGLAVHALLTHWLHIQTLVTPHLGYVVSVQFLYLALFRRVVVMTDTAGIPLLAAG